MTLNVLGTPLEVCGCNPKTGYFRDGWCRTDRNDHGRHVVCAKVTDEFLRFSRNQGNDLITPRPEWGFPGLVDGDHWCLCASRWLQAHNAGCAPPLKLSACHEKALETIPLELLKAYAVDVN